MYIICIYDMYIISKYVYASNLRNKYTINHEYTNIIITKINNIPKTNILWIVFNWFS